MQLRSPAARADRDATGLLAGIALVHIALHLLTNGNYGIFRDELYYIACSDRLAWGYVDHPPLSIAILAVTRRLFGDSVFGIRIPAALAGGAAVFLTGRLARRFGGGYDAQWLAALAYATAPTPLVIFGFFSMNGFDLLFWIIAAHIVARLLERSTVPLWLGFGVVVGLGILNKYSAGFFAAALIAGMVLTPERRLLRAAAPWVAGIVAVLIVLPHIYWEVANGLPTLEFIRTAQAQKITAMSPLQFIGAQIIEGSPFLAPVWLAGLGGLLFSLRLRRYRTFAWAYLLLLAMFIVQHGKPYYLAPAYPPLLAAGAVMLGGWGAASRLRRAVLAGWLITGGVALAPMAVSLLPPEAFVRYATTIGLQPAQAERHATGSLPQHFADRFGWENMARTVAQVYKSLPPSARATTVIVTGNYGEAGAIDYFGPALGLPKAVSGHNNYWLWGYGDATGDMLITVGIQKVGLDEMCSSVEQRATVISPYAMPYETNLPVYVCRGLKVPMTEAWQRLRRFI